MIYRCWYCDEFADDDAHPHVEITGEGGGAKMCPACFKDYSCAHCGEWFEDESEAVKRGSEIMHTDCVPYANAELAADAAYERWRNER